MDSIRLSPQDLESLIETFRALFEHTDHLWIFGSRVYADKKGGDIDLYIETACQDLDHILDLKLQFLATLTHKIGDQKIDVVINYGGPDLPIYRVAKEEGIQVV